MLLLSSAVSWWGTIDVYTLPQVVDMTGPETKILTGYGSLAQQHAKPGEIPPTTSGESKVILWLKVRAKPTAEVKK